MSCVPYLPPLGRVAEGQREAALHAGRREARTDLLRGIEERIGARLHLRGEVEWASLGLDDVVGSLTHKGTISMATWARLGDYRYLGVDLDTRDERIGLAADELAPEGLPSLDDRSDAEALAFSAKEAIYKALDGHPLRPSEFYDAPLAWRLRDGIWTAQLSALRVSVRCAMMAGWVVALARGAPTHN